MFERLRPLLILSACCALSLSACDKGEEEKPETKKAAKKEGKKAEGKEGKKAEGKEAEGKEAAAPEAKAVLTLGAAKLMEKSKPDEVLELLPDGGIKLSGKPLGTISADGKLTGPDGKVFLKVDADGKVLADGKPIGLELTEGGGRMTIDDKTSTITFAEDGSIRVEPKAGNGPEMAHEGCAGPVAKSCALVLFGMLAPAEEQATDEATPPEAKAVPAPEPAAEAKADG